MERLGRYELVRPLGEGGMGVVWEAVLVGPGGFRKPVALKVLKGGGAGLAREARLGGLLRHANLVEVFALEEVDGTWVCAMELVRGGTLARQIPLPPRAVVEVGRQVCAGLQHAHERIGLIHLDIKPANLLLDEAVVKVADFGVARARGFSQSDGVRGTVAYMSPEQAAGDRVDGRSDLWSLGVTLYELATGRLPGGVGSGPAMTWASVELTEPLAGGIDVAMDAVPWLESVLERCLALDPEDRFRSAEALSEALGQLELQGPGLDQALGVHTPIPALRRSGSSSGTLTRREPTKTNLGTEVDRFVGRQEELDTIGRAFRHGPLVTLKGTGGAGKTRLARQYAEQWRRQTHGQSWLVDLSTARDALELLGAAGEVLGVPLGGGAVRELAELLGRALAGRGPVLLILDNHEHLVDFGELARHWAGGEVKVLVTSRVPLKVEGEQVIELAPLPVPDGVALLVARAADRGRDVAGDPLLPELVRRLDGLPLALELAAGRLGMLSPKQVLGRLDKRLKLLSGGVRGGRQATLRATLDSSWELLDPAQRAALAQLTVFRGGFAVELVEEVVQLPPGAPWVLDVLESLVDASLLVARSRAMGLRFELLETVAAYASEQLGEAERLGAEARHTRVLARRFGSDALRFTVAEEGLAGWLRIEAELENVVVACERAAARGDVELAVALLAAASELLDTVGPHRRALALLERVEALGAEGAQGARVQLVRARVLRRLGQPRQAIAVLEEAARELGRLGETLAEGDALNHLGSLYRVTGRVPEGLDALERAADCYQRGGFERGQSIVWGNQGSCLYVLGRFEDARQHFERALLARRATGDRRGIAHLLANVAAVAQMEGQLGVAKRHYQEALRVHRDARDRRGEALTLANLGTLAADEMKWDRAERRWLEAMELRRGLGEVQGVASIQGYLAQLAMERGRMEVAEGYAEEALATLRQGANARRLGSAVGMLGGIALYLGRLEEARERLNEARDLLAAAGDVVGFGMACTQQAQVERAAGDRELAMRLLDGAVEALAGKHAPTHAMALGWRGLVQAELGRVAEARADLDAAEGLYRGQGRARGLAQVRACRALAFGDAEALAWAAEQGYDPGSPTGRLIAEAQAR